MTYTLYSVEYCRDLEIWVMGRSRSLKMTQIDRSTTYCCSIACTFFELFDTQNIVTLKSRLQVALDHRNGIMAPFDRSHTSSYSFSRLLTQTAQVPQPCRQCHCRKVQPL